ncbi:MAG TPA: hypothetical protein PK339_11030 [Flavitalea sp.]|nr:hypothetical protein [Flavitalea sp.]
MPFLLFLGSPVFSQNASGNYEEAFKLIEVWLDAEKDYYQIPGITAAILDNQEIIWSGAFGSTISVLYTIWETDFDDVLREVLCSMDFYKTLQRNKN